MLLSAVAVAICVRFGFIVLERTGGTGRSRPTRCGYAGCGDSARPACRHRGVVWAVPAREAAAKPGHVRARPVATAADVPRRWPGDLVSVVCLSAPTFMPFLLGPDYAASGPMLGSTRVVDLYVYLSVGSELWFIGSGTQRYLLAETLLFGRGFRSLALILIPRYKGLGAAWTTVLSYSVSAFWSTLSSRAPATLLPATARPAFHAREAGTCRPPTLVGTTIQDAFRQYDSDVASTYDKDREIEEHSAVEDRFIADCRCPHASINCSMYRREQHASSATSQGRPRRRRRRLDGDAGNGAARGGGRPPPGDGLGRRHFSLDFEDRSFRPDHLSRGFCT